MENLLLFILPVLGLALLGFAIFTAARSLRANPPFPGTPTAGTPSRKPLAIVIFNPTKFSRAQEARELITERAAEHKWEVRFFDTTASDPGFGQTKEALFARPDLVIACGGDGTVRAVAQQLAGGYMRMAVIPAGTGNLLARNLGLPIDDIGAAVDVALAGDDRVIDVGWLSLDGGPEHAFLVMAGVGFDAEVMADAPPGLKAKVGGIAYLLSGLRKLPGKLHRVRVQIGERVLNRRVRSVLIGNCGRLQAGIELMPQAQIDDGKLDVMVLSPKGVTGWAAVAAQVISRSKHRTVTEFFQGESVTITTGGSLIAQLDGDPIGGLSKAVARVEPRSLTVRVHS